MDYVIISTSDWRFPIQDFPQHLLARWPGTKLHPVQNPARTQALEFEIPMAHSELTGTLARRGHSLSFSGDLRDVAEFVLWCRSLAPSSAPLLLGDEGSPEGLELKSDVTAVDIFQAYDYIPPPPGWMNYWMTARPQWTLASEDFVRRLRLRWPEARVELLPELNVHRAVNFSVPMAHSEVTGSLGRKVPGPSFTGDLRDCVEFALWCRSIVPAEEILLFGEQRSLVLAPHTTRQDILQCFQP